ncbi:unnamed protein product, partial [Polarella glacialis]
FDGTDYGGRSLKVSRAVGKSAGKGGKDGPVSLATRLEVFIKCLSPSVTQDNLWTDFGECGKITKLNMPTDSSDKCKGFAWITFRSAE